MAESIKPSASSDASDVPQDAQPAPSSLPPAPAKAGAKRRQDGDVPATTASEPVPMVMAAPAPQKATSVAPTAASYRVAAGRAISSPRGILAGGEAITLADVGGSQERLDELADAGHLERS